MCRVWSLKFNQNCHIKLRVCKTFKSPHCGNKNSRLKSWKNPKIAQNYPIQTSKNLKLRDILILKPKIAPRIVMLIRASEKLLKIHTVAPKTANFSLKIPLKSNYFASNCSKNMWIVKFREITRQFSIFIEIFAVKVLWSRSKQT